MSWDRPLTDAQERALIELSMRPDEWFVPYSYGRAANVRTLEVLERLGYAETRERTMCTVARITAEGLALLNGMGD